MKDALESKNFKKWSNFDKLGGTAELLFRPNADFALGFFISGATKGENYDSKKQI